jgi:cell wall-associated NlpC family hydrolase
MTVVETAQRVAEIRSMLGMPQAPIAAAKSGSGTTFAHQLESTMDGGDLVAGGEATGTDVVAAARKYLGVPYVFGGTNPESGLDCSGFVQRAYADLGIKLPRVAKDQAKVGVAVPSLAQAKPGDLVAFHNPVDHIGIYVGNGQMIVAPHTGDKVKFQKVPGTPSAIRRIVPTPADPYPAAVPHSAVVRPASLRTVAPSTSGIPYEQLFRAAGSKYGVSPALLAAVAKVESGYDATAVSRAGARGLMQIMPATAAGLGIDALDPAQAVDGAARILSGTLKEFGSLPLALAAYNAGGAAVRRYRGIPPFAETQAYVPKVQAAMAAIAERGFS